MSRISKIGSTQLDSVTGITVYPYPEDDDDADDYFHEDCDGVIKLCSSRECCFAVMMMVLRVKL